MLYKLCKELNDNIVIVTKGSGAFHGCLLNNKLHIPCICLNPLLDSKKIKLSKNLFNYFFLKQNDFRNFKFQDHIACIFSTNNKLLEIGMNQKVKFPFLNETENTFHFELNFDDLDFRKNFNNVYLYLKDTINYFMEQNHRFFRKMDKNFN